MKCEIEELKKGGIMLLEKSHNCLILLGNIVLMKENTKNGSNCYQNEDEFDYHGIPYALCGNVGIFNCFTPKRILVIQMQ